MTNIFWSLYTAGEKHTAINNILKAVSKYGDMVDSKQFSDISLSMKIEIQEINIDLLYNELKQIVSIDTFDCLSSASTRERIVYLNITFGSGTGNLKIETPSVPG
jgi:hypothetical protein